MNNKGKPHGEPFTPGQETWCASDSPVAAFTVIFEDDGDTGYFYAHNRADESRVLDAVHIYNVQSVIDRDSESVAEILVG